MTFLSAPLFPGGISQNRKSWGLRVWIYVKQLIAHAEPAEGPTVAKPLVTDGRNVLAPMFNGEIGVRG